MSERQKGSLHYRWSGGKPKCEICLVELKFQKAKRCRKHSYNTGVKHHNWVSDRSKLVRYTGKKERTSSMYREWRIRVWERDNYKCRIADNNCNGKIEAHHILSWRDFVELRYEINNGITLCHAHHPRVRAEEKRLIPIFKELVSVSKETI